MYTYVCMYVHVHVCMCMYVCMYAYMYVCICIYGVCIYVCKYMYVCMYICMYVCIYPYTYVSNNYVLAQGSRVAGLYVQALRVQRVNVTSQYNTEIVTSKTVSTDHSSFLFSS